MLILALIQDKSSGHCLPPPAAHSLPLFVVFHGFLWHSRLARDLMYITVLPHTEHCCFFVVSTQIRGLCFASKIKDFGLNYSQEL